LKRLTDAASLAHYGRDWTRFWPRRPKPWSFREQPKMWSELVQWARANGQALVPSGGRTGLSGGAVAARGEIVVSLEKMRNLVEFDPDRAQSDGRGRHERRRAAATGGRAGWYYPVDWAAAAPARSAAALRPMPAAFVCCATA
jgi:FAD/FMN-containing dehydrogenase